MTINWAYFCVNLCLYDCKTDFISNLRKTDKSTAIKRNNASCLIDDECNLNDYGEFP